MFWKKPIAIMCAVVLMGATFPDTEDSYYKEAIESLALKNIVGGYEDGTYKPLTIVNRAEMLKIVMGGSGDVREAVRRCFSDVNPDAWYADYICTAEAKDIVEGYADGRFRPEQEVNYAEALKIVLNAFDVPVDATDAKPWYEPFVEFAHENNIMSKYSYIPWETVSRERMAEMVYRTIEYKNDPHRVGQRKNLSSGCTSKAPQSTPSQIEVNGVLRDFIFKLPKDYRGGEPRPIIFGFHGRTDGNEEVRRYLELETYGEDYIIVYPAGMKQPNGTFNWSQAGDAKNNLRDYAFFDAMLEQFSRQYCLDLDRVFVVGYSLGASFANSLACARAHVIRGVGSLGGSMQQTECSAPVAAILFHNPNDRSASFSGGEFARDVFLEHNACGVDSQPTEPGDFKCRAYTCSPEHPVVWCPHEKDYPSWNTSYYYPHNWPKTTAKYIFEFFEDLSD